MKKTLISILIVSLGLLGCNSTPQLVSVSSDVKKTNKQVARPTTEAFLKSTIYQIHLPLFTQEGTLKKAEEMLEHVKATGVDIVYLTPIAESDDDMNQAFWSKRQKASKFGNPKNPYRIKDYYKVDPMLGSDQDLKSFVDKAHSLGLKVMLDLVYYHCGPKAKLISINKDWVIRNKDGSVKKGKWTFPELNFKNPELREYLLKNMEYFVEKFDIDGYRTDVEAFVPADFWAEGYVRVKKLKPDFVMLAESNRASAQLDAYDANYSWGLYRHLENVIYGKKSAQTLVNYWQKEFDKFPIGARQSRAIDNHDTASDVKGGRGYEHLFGFKAMNAVFVLNFTIDGIPFIYNGNEIANDGLASMFSNRKYGRHFIAWENAMTDKGRERMALIQKLTSLKKSNPALYKGETAWVETSNPDRVVAFTRTCSEQKILVVVNFGKEKTDVTLPYSGADAKVLLQNGVEFTESNGKLKLSMRDFGYLVLQYK